MNNIPQRQNELQAIDKLKAQRHKYTIAKRYEITNLVVASYVVLTEEALQGIIAI